MKNLHIHANFKCTNWTLDAKHFGEQYCAKLLSIVDRQFCIYLLFAVYENNGKLDTLTGEYREVSVKIGEKNDVYFQEYVADDSKGGWCLEYLG